MDYKQLIATMTPEMYRRLRVAVELGKWPDGQVLSPEQRENALQAVIVWGEQHLPEDQRVGYIDSGHKDGDSCGDPDETPISWT